MTGRIPEQRGGREAPFLTVAEVGDRPAVRFGRSFRVPPEAVDDLIESARYTGQ